MLGLARNRTPAPPPPVIEPRPLITPGLLEAQAAHRQARANLEAVIHQGPQIRATVDSVLSHGRENHFTDKLTEAFYGPAGRPGGPAQ